MTFELRRTGKRVEFKKVPIGAPFFAHNKMWTRVSYTGASQMASSDTHASCCSFDIDPWDKFVEYVVYVIDGKPQYSDEQLAKAFEDLKPEDVPQPDTDDED